MIRTLLLAAFIVSTGYSTDLHPMEIERLKGKIGPDNPIKVKREQTRAPSGPIRNIAEWERGRGVLIRYPLAIPLSLVKALAEDDTVNCLVTSSYESSASNEFENALVNMDHVNFLNYKTDMEWTRDYGPWFIFDGNNDIGIVNFTYNRPDRINDNKIPASLGSHYNVPVYMMDVVHTGGNYMCDGLGKGASTSLVYEESELEGISKTTVDTRMKDYLGIEEYQTFDDPTNTYIDHIDCWGKILAPDKVLIREVSTSHPQYSDIETIASQYANLTSSYGTKYKIYRVYTDDASLYRRDLPYTNSFIMNGKVFVPQLNSQYDDDALEVYREAMPGYEVLGFIQNNSSKPWLGTDALHCRTHEMPDFGMLYIGHVPTMDTVTVANENEKIELKCKIIAHSGESLKNDSLLVCYKYSYDSNYKTVTLTSFDTDSFSANLPLPTASSSVEYYITASDNSGRREMNPFMGNQDPYTFFIDMGNVSISSIENIQRSLEFGIVQKGNNINVNYQMPNGITNGKLALFNSKGVKIDSKAGLTNRGKLTLGENLSSGIYFINIDASGLRQTKSFMIK